MKEANISTGISNNPGQATLRDLMSFTGIKNPLKILISG